MHSPAGSPDLDIQAKTKCTGEDGLYRSGSVGTPGLAHCVRVLPAKTGGGVLFLLLSTTFYCGYVDFLGAIIAHLSRIYALF